MLRICKHCQSPFRPHQKVPHQKFCSTTTCQNARRQQWQKRKLQNDEDYKNNQREAQKAWRQKHPDYWLSYRKQHPDYVARNKKLQNNRNIKARHGPKIPEVETDMIAKMDSLIRKSKIIPGYYMLYPIAVGKIAKMDELLVRIDVISKG